MANNVYATREIHLLADMDRYKVVQTLVGSDGCWITGVKIDEIRGKIRKAKGRRPAEPVFREGLIELPKEVNLLSQTTARLSARGTYKERRDVLEVWDVWIRTIRQSSINKGSFGKANGQLLCTTVEIWIGRASGVEGCVPFLYEKVTSRVAVIEFVGLIDESLPSIKYEGRFITEIVVLTSDGAVNFKRSVSE